MLFWRSNQEEPDRQTWQKEPLGRLTYRWVDNTQ